MKNSSNVPQMDWWELNKDKFPKIIKTKICPNCNNKTLNYYDDNSIICGYCMTWTYEIKK